MKQNIKTPSTQLVIFIHHNCSGDKILILLSVSNLFVNISDVYPTLGLSVKRYHREYRYSVSPPLQIARSNSTVQEREEGEQICLLSLSG